MFCFLVFWSHTLHTFYFTHHNEQLKSNWNLEKIRIEEAKSHFGFTGNPLLLCVNVFPKVSIVKPAIVIVQLYSQQICLYCAYRVKSGCIHTRSRTWWWRCNVTLHDVELQTWICCGVRCQWTQCAVACSTWDHEPWSTSGAGRGPQGILVQINLNCCIFWLVLDWDFS